MIGADQTQIIRPRPFHEAQVVGVIDDAGEIGVLIIDAHDEDVAPIANLAVKRNGASYFHGTRPAIDCSQFLPSNVCGLIVATSTSSRQRTFTSILSGSERGT